MVVNVADNRYGVAQFIVAPTIAEGANYTSIASALTDAVSGQTIFIRPGTFTENLILKAGVNLTAFQCDSSLDATGHVIISGNATMSTAGTVAITGIQLQTNSAALLTVSGSSASIVNLNNCYLNCSNATGISFSSSNASAAINVTNSRGNIGTTGISLFSHSSAGTLAFTYSILLNSGASTTVSTASAGSTNIFFTGIQNAITTSGTAAFSLDQGSINTGALNITGLTAGGSGAHSVGRSSFASGTASCISVSSSVTVGDVILSSSNANAITGAGTLLYTSLTLTGTAVDTNATTQVGGTFRPGVTRSLNQPAFLATGASQSNVTGDGTVYTVLFATEVFDQGSNYSSPTFTAPVTGRYNLGTIIEIDDLGAGHTFGQFTIVTSNRSYSVWAANPAAMRTAGGNNLFLTGSSLCDMDAADTATITLTVSNSTKTVDTSVNGVNAFYGNLVC